MWVGRARAVLKEKGIVHAKMGAAERKAEE
jgi:hypothetical protein